MDEKIKFKLTNLIKTKNNEDINTEGRKFAIVSLWLEILSILFFYISVRINNIQDTLYIAWVGLLMLFFISLIGGIFFRKKAKITAYNGKLLNIGFLLLIIQIPLAVLSALVFIGFFGGSYCYEPISSWMSWEQIATYSRDGTYEWPTQVLYNINLLLIVIFTMAFIQLKITVKRKDKTDWKQILLWFTTIILFIGGIISVFLMYRRVGRQTFVFSEICKDIKYYPITDQFSQDSGAIYDFCFTSKLYVALALTLFFSYIFALLAIKLKKIPCKIITGVLAGMILAYGIVTCVYSQKMETYWNDFVTIYYSNSRMNDFFAD